MIRFSNSLRVCLFLGVVSSLFLFSASAEELIWDADGTTTSGPTDGGGTWNTSNNNWWNGSDNISWANSFSNIAVFGSGGTLSTRIISVTGTVQAGGLKFAPLDPASNSYILQDGKIELADGAVIEIMNGSSHTGGSQRIELRSDIAGNDITIRKTGDTGNRLGAVQLRNAKSWTGTLTLEDATTTPGENLFVEVFSASAINNLDRVYIGTNSTMTINTLDEVTVDFTLNSLSGRGAIRGDASAVLLSGDILLEGNSKINTNNAGYTMTLAGDVTGVGNLDFGSSTGGTFVVNGVLAQTGGLTLSGGKVWLNSNNTMTGNIRITAGELIVNHDGALNSAVPQDITFSGSSAKTLTLNGHSVTVKGLIMADGTTNSNSSVQNGGAEDATLSISGTGLTFNGKLEDGNGGGVLNVDYNGPASGSRFALSGNNSYTGKTTVTRGTLIARSSANSLGLGTEVEVAVGARLELDANVIISDKHLITPYLNGGNNGGTWNGTVQAQSGTNNMTFGASSATAPSLTVNGDVNATAADGTMVDVTFEGAGTVTMNGDITDGRRFVKRGSGMVILNGSNTFNSGTAGNLDFGLSMYEGVARLGNENALYEGAGVYNVITFHSDLPDVEKRIQIYGVDVKARALFTGNSAHNSIVENGSDVDAVLVLVNPDSRTFGGVIRDGEGTGKLSLKITGGGTQTLTGTNTYTGDTTVAGGSTLVLDFSGTFPEPAPAHNIINHDVNESSLIMQGGVASIVGKAESANSQRLDGLVIDGGHSTIRATAGTGGSLLVNLGEIQHQSGYVNFIQPNGTQNLSNGFVTSSSNDSTGILGIWAVVNGKDLASVDANGNIVAYTGYVDVTNFSSGAGAQGPIPNNPLANVRIVDGGTSGNIQIGSKGFSAPTDINSLIQAATGDAVIDLTGWLDGLEQIDILRLGVDGLVMLAEGAGNLTIKADDPGFGGTLTAGGPNDDTAGTLTFSNYSTTSKIIVNADILDNGSGVVGLVKNGPGDLVLNSGGNDYTGGTLINGGLIEIAFDRSLGAVPSSFDEDHIIMNGGGLRTTTDVTLDQNRGITLREGGGRFDVTAGTFRVGKITGVGGFQKTGGGTLVLDQANDYDGVTQISSGILRIEHNQALGSTSGYTHVGSGASLLLTNGLHIQGETLLIAGNGNNQGALRLQGGTNAIASTAATWAGDIFLSNSSGSASRVGVDNFGTLTITGVIKDGSSNILNISAHGDTTTGGTQDERGVVVLAAKNTYTGRTEITRGTLKLGVDDALPEGTILQISIASSVTELMAFDLNGYDQTIAGLRTTDGVGVDLLNANANARIINSSSEKSVLTVKQDINTKFEGSIRGNIDLVKDGTGTLTLTSSRAARSGQTDYSGKTEIRGGTLALTGVGDLVGTNWIQVDQGAAFDVSGRTGGNYTLLNKTLSGGGTVRGDVRIDQHSIIRPGGNAVNTTVSDAGSGTGTLTFTGNLTLDPIATGDMTSSRMVMQLSSSNSYINDSPSWNLADFGNVSSNNLYDSVIVQGELRAGAGSTITLDLAVNHQLQWGQVFNLLDWGSINWDVYGEGAFNEAEDLVLSAELSELLTNNNWILDMTHFTSHGVVAIVPEPSRLVLLMTGLGWLWMAGTRKRTSKRVCS